MTETSRESGRPARIAVMPAFNEAETIIGVLDDLYPRIDRVIVVNDGSADATGPLVDAWAASHPNCTVIHFGDNRGLSAALRAGWDEVRAMLARGDVSTTDVAFSIDADGQHEPAAIDGMIEHLIENHCACVIGSRDMSYHTPYKKFGNFVMTLIARLSGGFHFEDVESGYRVFRIGPLIEAQQYYEGYRYSETVEVAVILARLGHKVCNIYPVAIPVARTRTRLSDAAIDAACMPLAWYRLSAWRDVPREQRSASLLWAATAVFALTAVALLMMAAHAFYLGDDSAHSYAHVWYISQSIWENHTLAFDFPQLENGDGVTFPYAFVPWVPAALLHPLLGDWSVTLAMVAGVAGMLLALRFFRPAFSNPILLALFLLNPLLWNGITQFQLASTWSFLFFFLGAGFLERGRPVWAVLFLALAMVAHPLMGALSLVLYALWVGWERRALPRNLVVAGALSAVLAIPAFVYFLRVPLVRDAGGLDLLASALDNGRRLSIPLLALAIPHWRGVVLQRLPLLAGAGIASTAAILAYLPPVGLWMNSSPQFSDYLEANAVAHDGSYRIMVANNREDGMVEFLRKGAVLSDEFFTESLRRKSFPSLDAYRCFLATKDTRHVVMKGSYIRKYHKNEPQLLEQLVEIGLATREFQSPNGDVAYRIAPDPAQRKGSLRACHL